MRQADSLMMGAIMPMQLAYWGTVKALFDEGRQPHQHRRIKVLWWIARRLGHSLDIDPSDFVVE